MTQDENYMTVENSLARSKLEYLAEQQRQAMQAGYVVPNQAEQYYEAYASSLSPTEMGQHVMMLEIDVQRLSYERDEARRLARRWKWCAWAIATMTLPLIVVMTLMITFGVR